MTSDFRTSFGLLKVCPTWSHISNYMNCDIRMKSWNLKQIHIQGCCRSVVATSLRYSSKWQQSSLWLFLANHMHFLFLFTPIDPWQCSRWAFKFNKFLREVKFLMALMPFASIEVLKCTQQHIRVALGHIVLKGAPSTDVLMCSLFTRVASSSSEPSHKTIISGTTINKDGIFSLLPCIFTTSLKNSWHLEYHHWPPEPELTVTQHQCYCLQQLL